jgi:hypothetical protein
MKRKRRVLYASLSAIHASVMSDAPDPPRKYYGFKAPEFERANPSPPPLPASGPTPVNSGPTEPDSDRIDVRTLAREANAGLRPLGQHRPSSRPNEVHAILRGNLDRANSAGLNEVNSRPRRSRRRRDYLITMLLANALLVAGAFIMPVFGIAGLILFNLGYTWIVWVVMDDY